ncbi:hypothetical protein SAMN05216203_2091 [Marinobacter daqiaonensis]|uniref:DUF1318 domain-containing protein n=1 Tax=Marinobacter daqiaonensis TaxID=650891 RepID=A0A1I6IC51_9GAMM|nr:YdbL family protein [Marinobacter daqiaonensis]SFR64273.1 hypothetical protein SAMN05216203_2091 [Marinobacter daqiaonensis]
MTLIKRATMLLLMLCLSLPALAMELEEAKSRLDTVKTEGLVGEKPDGYLGVVSPGGDAAEIVKTINDARRQEYQRIAEKHDIPVAKVEAVAGKKALEKTPAGQYIQVDGNWVRK